jgi:hypothetical protein
MQVHELFDSETQRSQKPYNTKCDAGRSFEAARAVDAGPGNTGAFIRPCSD